MGAPLVITTTILKYKTNYKVSLANLCFKFFYLCSFPVSFFSFFFSPLRSPQEPLLIILIPTSRLVYQQTHIFGSSIWVCTRVYVHTQFYQSNHFSCSNNIFIIYPIIDTLRLQFSSEPFFPQLHTTYFNVKLSKSKNMFMTIPFPTPLFP